MSARGGVVLETARGRVFVPSEIAIRVVRVAGVTRVPGVAPPVLGVAVADGKVVTVLALGDATADRGRQEVLVCDLSGEAIAVAGARALASGVFEDAHGATPGVGAAVVWDAERVPVLDLRALYANAEAATWAARAERRDRRHMQAEAPEERDP